jgi:acyl-CoA reductase-like NAD-dependent aldehyde dehydrogenase
MNMAYTLQQTISPVDGRVVDELPLDSSGEIDRALGKACQAQRLWRGVSIEERAAFCTRFIDAFVAEGEAIADELTWQMGRPRRYTPGEVRGFEERGRYMIGIAPETLAAIDPGPKPGFQRFIQRDPLGVVLTVAAWNYPYLIAVNSVVPALMAGNVVILKHSSQTPLCAERMAQCFARAGLPDGVFQVLHIDHRATEQVVQDARVNFVAFTGSVRGGEAIQRAAAARFVGVGLELGGKDPAYVRADADVAHAIENLVDGSYFNSGQSCCAVERIYVHGDVYDEFVSAFVELTRQYRLGDPLDPDTTLGPLVRTAAADFVRAQVAEAVEQGAKPLIDSSEFTADRPNTPYLAPQVLTNVSHQMRIMTEETFGPAVGIQRVDSDEEAVHWMNDSSYGLTASVWTRDVQRAIELGQQVETGTWFMNRCDYLDPALAWVGVKDSGRGCTLSCIGYEHLTRPKSFHLRV